MIANLLRDRGYLILTTQNRSIYMLNSPIAPPAEGQLRRWVMMQELRRLFSGRFECLRPGAVEPGGNRGLLGEFCESDLFPFADILERTRRPRKRTTQVEADTAHAGPKTQCIMPVERRSLRPLEDAPLPS